MQMRSYIQTRTLVERRRGCTIEMKWDRGTRDANARVLDTQTAERVQRRERLYHAKCSYDTVGEDRHPTPRSRDKGEWGLEGQTDRDGQTDSYVR